MNQREERIQALEAVLLEMNRASNQIVTVLQEEKKSKEQWRVCSGMSVSAIKRSSMDLTRALAKLRRVL